MQNAQALSRTSGPACEFAAAFANAVTVKSSHKYDWVARRGKHSIYDILKELVPEVSVECIS